MASCGLIRNNFFSSLLHSHDTTPTSPWLSLPTQIRQKLFSKTINNTSERTENVPEAEWTSIVRSLNFNGRESRRRLFLDTINPSNMKNSPRGIERLADELGKTSATQCQNRRAFGVQAWAVAELTVATSSMSSLLLRIKSYGIVGHQAYPHKILTGRRSKMHTIRQNIWACGLPQEGRKRA
ncbi:UNVERIFIED_CONTAM: putative 1-deoxy-D-xylulose-5-phosphate synthase 2, chloroplastic [Sesamum latifolium]|uniref:1-deoxy-D-xylulose-5-phosphate synthase 2, chloroplastic n=1 Tax=Sesamum latifolium TaxID=2727402 RepID=A0AAW2VIT9_9LAMI